MPNLSVSTATTNGTRSAEVDEDNFTLNTLMNINMWYSFSVVETEEFSKGLLRPWIPFHYEDIKACQSCFQLINTISTLLPILSQLS